jgi:hypothetical protein
MPSIALINGNWQHYYCIVCRVGGRPHGHHEAANEKGSPLPHIKYRSAFDVEILNSWLNEICLLTASSFLDLFPDSEGSHYQPDKLLRPIPVSLEEFAKWAMTRHSHRFARHPIFPYILYDTILLRQSTVGNFLQPRKNYWVLAQVDILSVT